MGRLLASIFVITGVWAVSCSPSNDASTKGRSTSALYGGTVIPDASQTGVVYLEWFVNQNDLVACSIGTGVLITSTTILTAGHAADYEHAKYMCSPKVPKFLRITMPAPADAGGDTKAWISCGTTCGEKLHPKYRGKCGDATCDTNESPTSCPGDCPTTCGNHTCESPQDYETLASGSKRSVACPKDCPTSSDNADGSDAALIETSTTFKVAGDPFHERRITRKATSDFYNSKLTCYGMGPGAAKPYGSDPNKYAAGVLRKADFTAMKFPHPLSSGADKLGQLSWPNMFAISRGGEVEAGPFQDDAGEHLPITVRGDSGGPCIAHTTGTAGDIVGIDHAGSDNKSGGYDAPEWAHFSAASGFRDFVDCRLKQRNTGIWCDADGDGVADDKARIGKSALNTLTFVVEFNNGAQKVEFDTLVPASLADVGCLIPGDFDADGDADLLSTIGAAISAIPAYFNGAAASSFSFSKVAAWQPAGPYSYYTVGRFDGDAVDDVRAVRFDGSEDVFLGEKNVGLTTPAHFMPRGFNWYGPGDEETFAISAPGSNVGGACTADGKACASDGECCGDGKCVAVSPDAGADASAPDSGDAGGEGGPQSVCQGGAGIQPISGAVYLLADNPSQTPDGLELSGLSLSVLSTLSPTPFGYASSPGDLFGKTLAWGSFDGDHNRQDLVIGAPGVTVEVSIADASTATKLPNAGIVAVFRRDGSAPNGFDAVALDRKALAGDPVERGAFGQHLAAGDFNGDSRDDLAIRSATDVQILYGQAGVGLKPTGTEPILTSADLGLGLPASLNGGLTTGDFNCDGYEDLAIGDSLETVTVPGPDGGMLAISGAVVMLYGSSSGLDKNRQQRIDRTTMTGLAGGRIGEGLAAGNFNGDSRNGRPCVDLALHVSEGTGSIPNGAVHVLFGGSDGLRAFGAQHLYQGGPAADGTIISDTSEPGDGFGLHLAITRADLDQFDDLVIGAFNENGTTGAAHVLRGGPDGITATGQAFWRQGDPSLIPDKPETVPNPNPLSAGDRFGWSVGGTSNGVIVVGAAWEDLAPVVGAPEVPNTGWTAIIRVKDQSVTASNPLQIDKVLPLAETPLYRDAFLGSALTKARPAFVARTKVLPRYAGNLVLTSGSRLACLPDATPPSLGSVTITPSCLWPPNSKLVVYELGSNIKYQVSDDCDPQPTVRIVSITSSEPASGQAAFGFDTDSACLRSERLGSGAGRSYTITLEARDASGNVSHVTTTVSVPKASSSGCAVAPGAFAKDGDPRCTFQ